MMLQTDFKEKVYQPFSGIFCAFGEIRAILTGLNDDALTTTIRLVGRHSRNFSIISTMICLHPSHKISFLGNNVELFNSIKAFFNLVALIGEKFFVHHFSEIDSIVNFLFHVNQPHQTIKDQTKFHQIQMEEVD